MLECVICRLYITIIEKYLCFSVHKFVMDCVTAITKCLISSYLLSVDYGMIQGIFHNAVDLNRL